MRLRPDGFLEAETFEEHMAPGILWVDDPEFAAAFSALVDRQDILELAESDAVPDEECGMDGESPVTHQLLRDGQLAIQHALNEHVARTEKIYDHIVGRADKALEVSQANALVLVKVESVLDAMMETRGEQIERLERVHTRVAALEAEGYIRKGERGLVAAIFHNKVVGWFVAVVLAAYAFLAHSTSGVAKP